LTDICYDDNIISMRIFGNTVMDGENVHFITAGLSSISGKSLKHLKNIAQALVAIQTRPGYPLPDSICQEIMWNSVKETFPVYDAQL